jgi:hypothetical protein
MSLIYKSNKYKLKYYYGGGLGMRPGAINTIIKEIKERLNAYAKEYNEYSYKQQLSENELINLNSLNSWGDLAFDDDTEINRIINIINQYLPNFAFIWNTYYKELITSPKRTTIFSSFPYNNQPSSEDILKLLFTELSKLEKKPFYDDPIIRKIEDEEVILRRLQEERERLEREENERLEKQRIEEERKLEIKRQQQESLIPISEFCSRGYNSQQKCMEENCSKLHFPLTHYNSKKGKISNVCPHEISGMCQHYGKLCTKFHAKQAGFKIYESGVLKGFKTGALNTVPNKGRIIGQTEKDYLKKSEEEKQRKEELKRQKLAELSLLSDNEVIGKRVCLLNNSDVCGRIESRIRINHGGAGGGYFIIKYNVRLDDQKLYTGDDIFLRELTKEEKEARKLAKLLKNNGVTRGTNSKEKRSLKPEQLINSDEVGEIEPEELTESIEVVVTLPIAKEIFEENLKEFNESVLDIMPEIENIKQFQSSIHEYTNTINNTIKGFVQIKAKLLLKLKDDDLALLESETSKLRLIIKDFKLLITDIDLKINDTEKIVEQITKNRIKDINNFIKEHSNTDERLLSAYNKLNNDIPNLINLQILVLIKELKEYQQKHRTNRKRLQDTLNSAFNEYSFFLRSFRY